MVEAAIVQNDQIPPRGSKWAAAIRTIAVLKDNHTLVLKMDSRAEFISARSCLYKGAEKLGFKVSIKRRGPLKLYVTRLQA